MRLPQASAAAALALATACNVGPEPRASSAAASVPIHNTAAVVENLHAVTEVVPSAEVLSLLRAPDRDPRDVALDARYQAPEVLTFLGVHSGERTAVLAVGGGYFTELFARGVSPGGVVFANEPPTLPSKPVVEKELSTRLERAANADVMAVSRDLESPLPGYARNLDLVYLPLPYRTAERLGVDTKKMDKAVFDALRSGGRFVLIDYRPRMRGPSKLNLHVLHQVESTNVRREVEGVGLQFVTEGRFLHDEPRPDEWTAIGAPDPTALEEQDRYVLEFVKP